MENSPGRASDVVDHTRNPSGVSDPESQPSLVHGDRIGEEEASRLAGLATEVRDQDDLQRDVFRQADQHLTEQANERDYNRLDKTQTDKAYVVSLQPTNSKSPAHIFKAKFKVKSANSSSVGIEQMGPLLS